MTIQVDDRSLPSTVAAGAAWAVDAVPYVHPATRVTVEHGAVPLFDVVAEPVTGRLDLVGEFDLACGQRFRRLNFDGRAYLAGPTGSDSAADVDAITIKEGGRTDDFQADPEA